jgi:hypothetical protein
MAKRFGKILSVGIGALCVLTAATALAAGPWSSAVTIATIEIGNTSTGTSTYLGFNQSPSGKPACANSWQAVMSGTADNVKSMTALATSAFFAGRTVQVYWDGTCAGGIPSFSRFSIGGGI